MVSASNIDRLILNEKKSLWWYFAWFGAVVFIGVGLIVVNLQLGWIKEVGPAIGSAFISGFPRATHAIVCYHCDRLSLRSSLPKAAPGAEKNAVLGKCKHMNLR